MYQDWMDDVPLDIAPNNSYENMTLLEKIKNFFK